MDRLIWALFGNDDAGPYGIYEHTPWGAVKWWLRNPAHNLFWHVLNKPDGPFWRFGKVPGLNGYFGFRPWANGAFGIALRYERNVV